MSPEQLLREVASALSVSCCFSGKAFSRTPSVGYVHGAAACEPKPWVRRLRRANMCTRRSNEYMSLLLWMGTTRKQRTLQRINKAA